MVSRFDVICGRKLQKENRVFPVIKRTEFLVQRKRTFEPDLLVHGPEENLKTKLKTIQWVCKMVVSLVCNNGIGRFPNLVTF